MAKDKIVLFGAGDQAAKDFYLLQKKYEIEYILDNNINEQYFHGKRVEKPDDSNVRPYFIVVCTNDMHYVEISEQLKGYGLEEINDFCSSQAFGKQVVVAHGNCHIGILKAYMMSSEIFKKSYWIYPLPLIQHNSKGYIDEDVLRNCDVFIHQDIRRDNSQDVRLSDEYTVPRISKECRNIVVPNLYAFGKVFFPQTIWNKKNHKYNNDEMGMFPLGDVNIENFLEKGLKNIDEILEYVRGEVYSSDFIQQEFKKYVNKMMEREKYWDVKIMDYILENYRKQKLFYDIIHPCNDVIKNICIRIFRLLGIDEQSIGEINVKLGRYEEPVYPCVIQALGLEWDNQNLRKDGYKLTDYAIDFDEYYRQYLYWDFEI